MATLLYTYLRRRKSAHLGTASNAAPPSYSEKGRSSSWPLTASADECTRNAKIDTEKSSAGSEAQSSPQPALGCPVAVFPQYVAKEATKLVMKEDMIPYLPGSFTVWQDSTKIFEIDRERPSLTHRTNIIDARTQDFALAVRRNIYSAPVSYSFEDCSSKKVVDLQGEFFVPCSGAKLTAHMVNAETGKRTTLTMKGSYLNRHAIIKDESGRVMVRMLSNIFEGRNMVGHRRKYELTIQPGFDIALAVAMTVALHEREQQHC
jgi:hypothetical protein